MLTYIVMAADVAAISVMPHSQNIESPDLGRCTHEAVGCHEGPYSNPCEQRHYDSFV